MENLQNEFVVNRPIEQAWAVLTDLERIAPCLPGAQLQEIEGEFYRGVVKVKLGPISTAFKGQAQFLERDDAGHRAVLRGEGRDTGGKGNADALITAELQSLTDTTTKCVVTTELRVTGKVAQFGRGIMGDISEKLMTQFANNLNTMLDADQTPAVEATTTPAVDAEPTVVAVSGEAPAPAPAVRTVNGPEAAPIQLSGLAGGAVLKRVVPLLAAVAAIVVAAVLIWG
ncbi:MAG: hypothetical protein F2681_08805 [Actinobacteria bacterium]|uniref:Unannotated protein n=1 Tax=freshwater metagenome TaxID=449393 RepID=A0A6J6ZJY4_9ZZZZ|nr:hypothetical protein [Actinomycetota bacterium]MSW78017.1 hypothetical protein [Actinomycetota bacterium]MSX55164.1 hypothetical protein [Actinomycetota bacterium]MSX93049.1 hypothetical protein [Actinomycetota bacterium]MSZ83227.1 hypothetical protein [Actinomycetota bacterium]